MVYRISVIQKQSREIAPRRVAARLFSRQVRHFLLLNRIHVPAHADTYSQAEQFLIDVPVVELSPLKVAPIVQGR